MTGLELSCPRCGTLNASKADYCNLCQTSFAAKISPGPAVSRPVASGPVASEPAASAPEPGEHAQALSGNDRNGGGDQPGKPALKGVPMLLFTDAERHNIRLSLILFLALFGIFVSMGTIIGTAAGNISQGLALGAILYVVLAGTAYYNGSKIILSFHGAEKADQKKHQLLLNVVEEMSIACGLPAPDVYVMSSTGMNAFAAGRNPREAIVAVTQGLLDNLNREELQGVIAHEMAHIKSRDTLYNICAAVLVGAISMLSRAFLRGTFSGRRAGRIGGSRSGGRGSFVFIILGIVFALLAPLAAKILQMSISRQREYHADAAAAEFTRNPLGLASALSRIAGGDAHVPGENQGTQHLFIVNPLSNLSASPSDLMSTHPATELRIRRLRAMAGLAKA